MPIRAASSSARSGSHSSYAVRKPSSSTWISRPPMVVTGMAASLLFSGYVLAGHRHVRRQRDRAARQQKVPVHPPERELAPVVDGGLAQEPERPGDRNRVSARQRLGVVVEV